MIIEKETIPFQLEDKADFGEHIKKRPNKLAKVYRKMFAIQNETLIMQRNQRRYSFFFRNSYVQVSDRYFESKDNNLSISPPEKKLIAYIMFFYNQKWVPIYWGKKFVSQKWLKNVRIL